MGLRDLCKHDRQRAYRICLGSYGGRIIALGFGEFNPFSSFEKWDEWKVDMPDKERMYLWNRQRASCLQQREMPLAALRAMEDAVHGLGLLLFSV